MTTVFHVDDPALRAHLLQFQGIQRNSAGALEFDAALFEQVNEVVREFYDKRRRSRNGAINGAIRRSHPRPGGVVINTPEQLMAALTRT